MNRQHVGTLLNGGRVGFDFQQFVASIESKQLYWPFVRVGSVLNLYSGDVYCQ